MAGKRGMTWHCTTFFCFSCCALLRKKSEEWNWKIKEIRRKLSLSFSFAFFYARRDQKLLKLNTLLCILLRFYYFSLYAFPAWICNEFFSWIFRLCSEGCYQKNLEFDVKARNGRKNLKWSWLRSDLWKTKIVFAGKFECKQFKNLSRFTINLITSFFKLKKARWGRVSKS